MTQSSSKPKPRRGRLFPELTISPEARARQEAEEKVFDDRCRKIFERLQPELIKNYYNWFIVIEPDSGDYFIDSDRTIARQKAREKHPKALFFTFGINETGAAGRI